MEILVYVGSLKVSFSLSIVAHLAFGINRLVSIISKLVDEFELFDWLFW